MQIPTLPTTLSVLKLRQQVLYTLTRLRHRPWAKTTWVPTFEGLLKDVDTALAAEQKLLDALESAEAAADAADIALDDMALHVDKLISLNLWGDQATNFRKSLFGEHRPSEFIRPRLREELEAMRTWPKYLKDHFSPNLNDLAKPVESVVAACDGALKTLTDAETAAGSFAANERDLLVRKVDAQRQLLGGEAKKQGRVYKSRNSEDGLFMGYRRRRAAPLTLSRAQRNVAEAEADLAEQRQVLSELMASLAEKEHAEAELAAREQKLLALLEQRKKDDEAIAALRDEIADAKK